MKELLEFSQEDVARALQAYVQQERHWVNSKVTFEFFKGSERVVGFRVSALVEHTQPQHIDPLE